MASSIVKSAGQQLGNLLVEEAKTLYKVRDKIESLQTEMEWMECFLRDADTKQHQERVVCRWVSQVRDIAYDAEDILARYLHDISHHRQDGIKNTLKWFSCILYTCDAWTLHNLGSDIDDLTIKLSELTSRLQRYGIQIISPTRSLEYNAMIREERRTYSYTKEDVVGFDDDIREVVNQLVNTDFKVVGISGIGGLGKTTLARKVFKHKDVRDQFYDNCVWIYISKEFDRESIFQEIFLGLEKGNVFKERKPEHEKRNETKKEREGLPKGEQLVGEIHNLLQVKRCLIVLDDIWYTGSWEKLKPAFESIRGTSSKILLTTRNQGLLRHVDLPGYPHPLKPLSFENSWKLLQRKAFNKHGKAGDSSTSGQKEIAQNEPQVGDSTSGQKEIESGQIEAQDDDQLKREAEPKSDEMEKLGKEMLKHCDGLPIAIVALGGILSTKKTISEWKDVQKNISSYLISNIEQEGSRNSRILEVLELSYQELPFYLKPCFLYLGYFPEDYKISTQKLYHLWEAEGLLVREGEAKKQGGTSYDIGERYLNELVQRSMVEVEECWASGRIKTCKVHDVMRDMCLRKCEEVGFLNHIQCTESDTASTEIKKLRRCALHDQKGDFVDKHFENQGKELGLRSLLVFGSEMSPKIWTSFPLLRVLDLEGIDSTSIAGVGHLIHLRYLSLRNSKVWRLPSSLYGLKYLETLDLRSRLGWEVRMRVENKFYEMTKLRHLYLPTAFIIESGGNLSFPVGQMETLKNIDPLWCEMGELMQMGNLRIFSISKGRIFSDKDEVKGLLESPVMKNPGQLINSFRLRIYARVINELEPTILSSLAHHPSFNELCIVGARGPPLKKVNNIFVDSLTRVELEDCKIGGEEALALEKLPLLKFLHLTTTDIRLSFSADSFPQLTQLTLDVKHELEEWEIGDGALPTLQRLELSDCKKLTKVNNIPNTLTEVKLKWCVIGGGLFVALEKLPRLQQLQLVRPIIGAAQGNTISFSTGSFPHLTQLSLKFSDEMKELEFGDGALPNLQRLELFYCYMLNTLMNLPNSLTQVELRRCIGTEGILSALGKLPRLQQLSLTNILLWGCNKKMSFSPSCFPHLTQLMIWASELEELEVGDAALPNLQRLELNSCEKLKRIPDGLPASVHIECRDPCIKGIEKYMTCPNYKPSYNPMRWIR